MELPSLPGEDEHAAAVRVALAPEFDFARRLYRLWRSQDKDRYLAKSDLPALPLHFSMLLNTQAYRHFRSAIELCRFAEAIGANIVSRSLFETVVTIEFLLRPHLRIIVEQEIDKATQKQKVDLSGNPKAHAFRPSKDHPGRPTDRLSRDMRAELYLAHGFAQDEHLAEVCRKTPGLKRVGKCLQAGNVAMALPLVTADWRYIHKHKPYTYSGLSIASLAELLGKKPWHRWYQTVYHIQSRDVHAGSALGLLTINSDGSGGAKSQSSIKETAEVMHTAIAMFLHCIWTLQRYIGFGSGAATAIHGLQVEFAGLQQREIQDQA